MSRPVPILGPDGRPLASSMNGRRAHQVMRDRSDPGLNRVAKFLFGQANTYAQALANVPLSFGLRAQDPFGNHPWVFVAAVTAATVASQAPLRLMRETKDALDKREAATRAKGLFWPGPRAGLARRAVQRHLDIPWQRRILARKTAEPELEHPLTDVLLRPNPYQSGRQLLFTTHIWLQVRGEMMWVRTDKARRFVAPGVVPEMLWPIPRECFDPIRERGTIGEIVGWRMRGPEWSPWAGEYVNLVPSDVIHFRIPHPSRPDIGLARITAAAAAIESDLMIRAHNRALLLHNAVPKVAVEYEGDMDETQRAEWMERWEDAHQGPENRGRVALLSNGFSMKEMGFNPEEMEFDRQRLANREEVLGGAGVPPSTVGLTEFTNYATAMAQDLTFWEKCILPMLRDCEATLDAHLLVGETDDLFAAHDLTGVDALRAGLSDKLAMAERAAGEKLHMPPRTAFALVGLDVPEYPGDEDVLVSPLSTTLATVLADPSGFGAPPAGGPGAPGQPGAPAADDDEDDGGADPTQGLPGAGDAIADNEDTKRIARGVLLLTQSTKGRRADHNRRRLIACNVLESRLEPAFRRAYRGWVESERRATMRRLEAAVPKTARGVMTKADLSVLAAILPDLKESAKDAALRVRPTYAASFEQVFDTTRPDLGIPVFDIGDARFVRYFQQREGVFSESISKTQYEALASTLREGIGRGETLGELRMRVGQVYDVGASHWKTLQVTRTESAGFVNGARNEMFGAQGFTKEDWATAEDEAVRTDHQVFGAAGPQERGFNYLTLVGGGGTLRFPGDMDAPPGQIINCRCAKVPVE